MNMKGNEYLDQGYYWNDYSKHENDLIRQFQQDLQPLNTLSRPEFDDVLIQSAKVSLNFVPWYDRAIICLDDPEAKQVLRKILQDETPVDAPSHREDLFADLGLMGISAKRVLMAPTTDYTKKTIDDLNSFVRWSCNCDLFIMAGCRMGGEVLVAEGYGTFLPILKKYYGLTEENSHFYWPHYLHDKKEGEGGEHTHSFEQVLQRLIVDEQTLAIAKESANRAFKIRLGFYEQFKPNTFNEVIRMREAIAKHPAVKEHQNIITGLDFLIDAEEDDLILKLN